MFSSPQPADRRMRAWSSLASLAIHGLVFVALTLHLQPVFVKPSLAVRGDRGTAVLIYTPGHTGPERIETLKTQPQKALLTLPVPEASQPSPAAHPPAKVQPRAIADQQDGSKAAGSPYGSDPTGALSFDEVRPALPLTFDEPHISRAELPPGFEGDVIVEITIDADGNVVEEKLLQTIGYGIDQKVLAALHEWRFRPATRNGVAIPSKHDVHYHFPG